MWKAFFIFFLVTFSFGVDLYEGITEKVEKGRVEEESTGPTVSFESLIDEMQLPQRQVKQALHRARLKELEVLDKKVSALDAGVGLPIELARDQRKKQLSLIKFQNALASRVVDEVSTLPAEELNPSRNGISNPNQFIHYQARKLLDQVPQENKELWKNVWKASVVDPTVRRDFATLLATASLYGADHPLARKAQGRMEAHEKAYQKNFEQNPVLSRREAVHYAFTMLNSHSHQMPEVLKRRFEALKLKQIKLASASTLAERKIELRKLDWEMDKFQQALIAEGLKKPEEEIGLEEWEESLKEFLEEKVLKQEKLHWPLLPYGEVSRRFDGSHPYLQLKAQNSTEILAVCSGIILELEQSRLSLQCFHYFIELDGDFKNYKARQGDRVKAGAGLASVSDQSIRFRMTDTQGSNRPVDPEKIILNQN